MSDIRLSICIPTYNYGRFIGATIDSIRRQYLPGTEIVILDGGSTDNTRDVIERYRDEGFRLDYHFQPVKGGIDRDMARTVALARGEYCWLLSADDALVDGALLRIHEEIASGCDVYLCNRILCDIDLRPQQPQSWLSGVSDDAEFSLDDDQSLIQYFRRANSIGALFSYMSTIIVRRESWNRLDTPAELMGTNYAHVHRLFNMRAFGGRMKYVAAPLVFCRGDNDSFLRLGLAGRHYIDLRGFHLIAEALFPHSALLRKQFKEVINREHHWVVWVWLRSTVEDRAEWEKIRRLLPEYGYGKALVFFMECLAKLPHGVLLAHKLRNLGSRISAHARKLWPA